MDFIYFGERFSAANTDGYFGSFTCLTSERGVEWDAIQTALNSGHQVNVRQATAVERDCMEELLLHYRTTGCPATSFESIHVYH